MNLGAGEHKYSDHGREKGFISTIMFSYKPRIKDSIPGNGSLMSNLVEVP